MVSHNRGIGIVRLMQLIAALAWPRVTGCP